jgi:hypothetical protein
MNFPHPEKKEEIIMSARALIRSPGLLVLFSFLVGVAGVALSAAAATDARVSESYGKLPLQFEANRGQTHKDVRFLSRGPGYNLYLTAGEAVLVLSGPNVDANRDTRSTQARPDKSVALRMNLVGAARAPAVTGLDELPGKTNYFVGKDRSKWRTNVPTYAKVRYENIYPGIDLVYYGNQRQLEYDFVLAPGADPKKIVLGFKGAKKLQIDAQGELVLHAPGGDIRQHKPVVYQDIDGVRHEIAGSYVRKGANRVGFKLAAYDASRPLVIDPVVLSYSTYLGGSGDDSGRSIAVDADGNAYVTGTASAGFPTTAGAFQPTGSGTSDVFVSKLNPAGSALVYSTYLGGSGSDGASGISVDAAGNAYVAGGTSSIDFPTTAGAFQATLAGSGNAFVAKLDPTGSALVYSTYLGGGRFDSGAGIAVDGVGNAYVTGTTTSTNFPTTAGAFQTTFASTADFNPDVFVTKLNPTGSALVYSTYIGGSGFDNGAGIAVDSAGNAYVTGATISTNFPTTAGAFQTTFASTSDFLSDAFVTKLDSTGSSLVYSTYLGGGSAESGAGIAVDASGSAYVTGRTNSSDFPTTPGVFQQPATPYGLYDAFVSKVDPAGSSLVYSARLGGSSSDDTGSAIAVDAGGNAYVTGTTSSDDFPTTPGAFKAIHSASDGWDVFVTQVDPTGSALAYSTYLGGSGVPDRHAQSGMDSGFGIAVDAAGSAYVTGITNATNFPTTPSAFQPAIGGLRDAFVAKFADAVPPPPPAPTNSGTKRSEESAATEIGFWATYGAETGSFSGGSIVASNVAASSAIFSFTGTAVSWIGVKCNVCGIAAVSIDGGAPTTVNTGGPNAPGSLSSESVFSASGLAAASHTILITVTGMSSSGGAFVAVDAFDVTAGSATSPLLPPVVLPPPAVVPPLPPVVGM